MIVKGDAIQSHIFRIYAQHHEFIKISLFKVKWIAFTSETWNSPNVKSLMALTAQLIETDKIMQELLLGIPAVIGKCVLLISWVQ